MHNMLDFFSSILRRNRTYRTKIYAIPIMTNESFGIYYSHDSNSVLPDIINYSVTYRLCVKTK